MKTIWHLFKFNLKLRSFRLLIISVVSLLVLVISFYFNQEMNKVGMSILQYSAYILFFILTNKLNKRNSSMLDTKYLQSLPLSKQELVFFKSVADISDFFPISFVTLYGFFLAFPEYHILAVAIILHLVLVLANMITLNKRVDFARMQFSKANIKNYLLYINKHLDIILFLGLISFAVTFILFSFKKEILLQEYFFLILSIVLLFFAFKSTVKMLSDERLSYFFPKRDFKRMGLKFLVLGIPLLILFGGKQFALPAKYLPGENTTSYLSELEDNLDQYSSRFEEQKLLLAVARNDEEAFDKYLAQHKSLPWEVNILGGYLPHIAAQAQGEKILAKLVELRPKIVNMPGKIKGRTPLFTALGSCDLSIADYLITKGADLNIKDLAGQTPMMFAARNGCPGGVVLLERYGADISLRDEEDHDVFYFSQGTGLEYYLKSISRTPASAQKK